MCDRILRSCKPEAWQEGMVGKRTDQKAFGVDAKMRSVTQQPLPIDASGFPLNQLTQQVSAVNSEFWGFDLCGFVADDPPWVMRYEGNRGDHNDWHVDLGRGVNASRKLGFSLQLSPADAYEGGNLEFLNLEIDQKALRRKGTLVAFPSYWTHRVVPVTHGTRYVLVGWVHGPTFR
jgi:PKHD-type hydroxylase